MRRGSRNAQHLEREGLVKSVADPTSGVGAPIHDLIGELDRFCSDWREREQPAR
jgi:hypothetical protein